MNINENHKKSLAKRLASKFLDAGLMLYFLAIILILPITLMNLVRVHSSVTDPLDLGLWGWRSMATTLPCYAATIWL